MSCQSLLWSWLTLCCALPPVVGDWLAPPRIPNVDLISILSFTFYLCIALQIYAVSRQALSLVAGGAIDVFLLGQLRLLRQVRSLLPLLNVALARSLLGPCRAQQLQASCNGVTWCAGCGRSTRWHAPSMQSRQRCGQAAPGSCTGPSTRASRCVCPPSQPAQLGCSSSVDQRGRQ